MKKVFFLMLTLMVLSAASVNAQVRIGGSTDPYGSAVLDLNATDDPTPDANKGGLSFPRISLDTTNVTLNGLTPKEGTVVYNTNASMKGGQGKGIYMWNGTKWNSLVATVPVTSVTLSSSGTVYIPVGATTQLTATVAPVNVSIPMLSWTSSNTNVATVSANGLITAKAVGTSTVTAASTDGSNKKSSMSVSVFADGAGTATNGTKTYRIYTFPNGVGTWMIDNSLEGVRDTAQAGFYYYSFDHAVSACVTPWVVPNIASATALANLLNQSPALSRIWWGTNYLSDVGGIYNYTLGYALRDENAKWWWTRDNGIDVGRGASFAKFPSGTYHINRDQEKRSYEFVRCIMP
jgi:hypothetical protein